MKIGILLDAGGVILDETEYENRNARLISRMLASKVSGYTESRYWKDVEESIIRYTPSTRKYVFWKYCEGDSRVFENTWKEFMAEWRKIEPALKLMVGIDAELRALRRDFKLVLAGQYGENIIRLLEKEGLMDLFENRKSQADFSITKPDPRYIRQIAEAAGLDCGDCVMVGDRIDKDVIPAKQNGMATVFVRTGIYRNQTARTPDESPDLVLDSVAGLAEVIKQKWK